MAPLKKPRVAAQAGELLLTDAELELMQIIWELESATVHEILQRLPQDRDLAYTTVSTICRILEQKGALTPKREGRSHRYVPNLSKSNYERIHLRHTVGQVFDGEAKTLVRCLISDGRLKQSDLDELLKQIQGSNESGDQ